jgi:hypothetical protein
MISDFTPCPINQPAYAVVGEVSVVDEYERDFIAAPSNPHFTKYSKSTLH